MAADDIPFGLGRPASGAGNYAQGRHDAAAPPVGHPLRETGTSG